MRNLKVGLLQDILDTYRILKVLWRHRRNCTAQRSNLRLCKKLESKLFQLTAGAQRLEVDKASERLVQQVAAKSPEIFSEFDSQLEAALSSLKEKVTSWLITKSSRSIIGSYSITDPVNALSQNPIYQTEQSGAQNNTLGHDFLMLINDAELQISGQTPILDDHDKMDGHLWSSQVLKNWAVLPRKTQFSRS